MVQPRSGRSTKLSTINPANTAQMKAAATAGADVVQLDLEDAVPAGDKDQARQGALEGLAGIDWQGAEVWVRVNSLDSGQLEEDVNVVTAGRPGAFILAKAGTPGQVQLLAKVVESAERRHGLPVGQIRLGVVIESAQGLSNVESIVTADERMSSLSIGGKDLAADIGYWRDSTGPGLETLYARSRCVLAARIAGIDSCDAAHPLTTDPGGTARSADMSMRLGFTMKTCWSAEQVETVRNVFALRHGSR